MCVPSREVFNNLMLLWHWHTTSFTATFSFWKDYSSPHFTLKATGSLMESARIWNIQVNQIERFRSSKCQNQKEQKNWFALINREKYWVTAPMATFVSGSCLVILPRTSSFRCTVGPWRKAHLKYTLAVGYKLVGRKMAPRAKYDKICLWKWNKNQYTAKLKIKIN